MQKYKKFDFVILIPVFHDELRIQNLKKEIFIWDPEVDEKDFENFTKINLLNNKKICYFIGTQHKAFLNISFNKGSCVLDPFRYIKKRDGVKIVEIGEGAKI